jgi:beta-lactamase class A
MAAQGLSRHSCALWDDVTRIDGYEPLCRSFDPASGENTSTPSAMLGVTQQFVLGDFLSPPSRQLLQTWMCESKTGDRRLRRGLPGNWRVGDKTGSGCNATANDIAVVWPPDCAPVVVVAFYTGALANPDQQASVLAKVGSIVSEVN